eukprot:CAMPEP_0113500784 /NCGR_PEP_ID=MMETSP0014_2-20120614/32547_1 /TAXON_ID=2857 /ORGANISM="Nitzschia sp." /LENGTH=1271 /DNA_ID=CAMNT_0000395211 /DNA_START=158 /DNA_END=3973 /DNA_ORIENTATION=+ /assembly_acc=CAM_ASM_000159
MTTMTTQQQQQQQRQQQVAAPVLDSLRYYDELRRNATKVVRYEGSNVDHVTVPTTGEEVVLCHISAILPFTTGDFVPQEFGFEAAANVALAAHHLNVGDGSIVPELDGLPNRCKVRFTTEFADTEFQGGVSLNHLVTQTGREPGDNSGSPPNPCAFIGAYRSAVSIPMSIVSGLLGYPQVSPGSTSADLDDASQYPLFGRTVPSDAGNAVPIVRFMREVLDIQHLAVVNVNDAYGNAFVEGMRAAADAHAPDMVFHQVPLDEEQGSIPAAVESIKRTGYRFVFCLVFTQETHDQLLTEAYNAGVAGTGLHNWLFADSFLGTLDGRTFEKGSPLHLAYRGSALLEASGGVPGIPGFDGYESKMAELNNPKDMEYLGSLWPKHDDPAYGATPPFVDSKDFLSTVKDSFAPFNYEAAIALGLSACAAYADTASFSGQEHFDRFKETTFTGVSGPVTFDSTTGTREPASTLYKVGNFVEEEADDGGISFKGVVTDLFLENTWNRKTDYVFNDGTTNLPDDLPPPMVAESDELNLGVIIGVPIAAVILLGVVLWMFYENQRKKNDSVWEVNKEELHFSEVIGQGTFGLVHLAEYRGTQVAVKSILPPKPSDMGQSRIDSTADTDESDSSPVGSTSNGIKNTSSGYYNGKSSWGGTGKTSWGRISLDGTVSRSSGPNHTSRMASGMASKKSRVTARTRRTEAATLKMLKKDFIEEMRHLSKLRHPCITTIMGAVTAGDTPMIVLEYLEHGSLYDLLHNETMVLEGELLLPIVRDISQGVRFLHAADPQVIHGDLKAANILVDRSFRAKVADFGLSQKKHLGGTGTPFWMAPELLRNESSNTAASDVFSFGIALYEVFSRRDPYEGEENTKEILSLVCDKQVQKRPLAPRNMPDKVKSLMADCVEDDPETRPTFEELDKRLQRINAESVDAGQVGPTRAKSSSISLFDIFPRHIAEALRDGRTVEAEHKDSVTIFFSDIVGFTTLSSTMEPRKVADLLDRLYTQFDQLSQKYDCYKVETIGDAYMAVTNLVKDQEHDHAQRIAEFAIDAVAAANDVYVDLDDHAKGVVNIRCGFHSGSVVADVVGTRNPRYCLFGDAVNTASRMESNSKENRIHCSAASYELLKKQCPGLPVKCRGRIPVKGKGKMKTYWVNEGGTYEHDGDNTSVDLDMNASDDQLFMGSGDQITAELGALAEVDEDIESSWKSRRKSPKKSPRRLAKQSIRSVVAPPPVAAQESALVLSPRDPVQDERRRLGAQMRAEKMRKVFEKLDAEKSLRIA